MPTSPPAPCPHSSLRLPRPLDRRWRLSRPHAVELAAVGDGHAQRQEIDLADQELFLVVELFVVCAVLEEAGQELEQPLAVLD